MYGDTDQDWEDGNVAESRTGEFLASTAKEKPAPTGLTITRKQIVMGSLIAILAIGLNVALLILPIPYQQIGEYGYGGVFVSSVLSSAGKGLPIPLPAILLISAHFLNPFVVGLIY